MQLLTETDKIWWQHNDRFAKYVVLLNSTCTTGENRFWPSEINVTTTSQKGHVSTACTYKYLLWLLGLSAVYFKIYIFHHTTTNHPALLLCLTVTMKVLFLNQASFVWVNCFIPVSNIQKSNTINRLAQKTQLSWAWMSWSFWDFNDFFELLFFQVQWLHSLHL